METTIKTNVLKADAAVKPRTTFLTPAFWAVAEFNRFGIVPAILTIVICITAFAAACAAQIGLLPLILIGTPTALFISSIIAVSPMRLIFAMAAVTIVLDIIVFFM